MMIVIGAVIGAFAGTTLTWAFLAFVDELRGVEHPPYFWWNAL